MALDGFAFGSLGTTPPPHQVYQCIDLIPLQIPTELFIDRFGSAVLKH